MRTADLLQDMENASLNRLFVPADRLLDDVVARLSELAEKKVGRLNFYFASIKLKVLDADVDDFTDYIQRNRFEEKRNANISHKELPEKWPDHKSLHIEPRIILRGIAKALRLMKRFDLLHLGPSAAYLWREARKRRYQLVAPPKAGYLLLPHLRLPNDIRVKVALDEIRMGISYWDDLPTQVDGQTVTLKGNKKWGIVKLGAGFIVTPEYPLIELKSITCGKSEESEGVESKSEVMKGVAEDEG